MSGDFIPPNRKLYLTPDAPVEGRFCRQLSIPDTPEWVGLVDGLLSTFAEAETWRQFGSLTPEETAEAFLAILIESWSLDGCGIPSEVPAPFWDDAVNSDDQLEPAEQIWYGLFDGSFTEDIDIWLIAGFIAYSGQIGAAISFVTLAKQFKLAWKSGDLGGIIRVFIDGADVGTVDTYSASPGIVEQTYAGDPDEDEHSILMVLESVPETFTARQTLTDVDAPMMVVRKRLDASEGAPPDTRYNPDCDCVETSTDGGATWTENPGADPRSNPAYLMDTTGNEKCGAAEGVRVEIAKWVLGVVGATSVVGLANLSLTAALFLIPVSWMFGAFWAVANAALTIGAVTIGNAFTPEVLTQLKCIFEVYMDSEGRVDDAALDSIRADIVSAIGDPVVTACFDLMRQSWGAVGFTNAGVVNYDPEANCDDCAGWCFTFNLEETNAGAAPFAVNGCSATYSGGVGWTATKGGGCAPGTGQSVLAAINITYPSTYLRKIVVVTESQSRTNGLLAAVAFSAPNRGGTLSVTQLNVANGTPLGTELVINNFSTGITAEAQNTAPNGVTHSTGTTIIKQVTFYGDGDCPFGEPNCYG